MKRRFLFFLLVLANGLSARLNADSIEVSGMVSGTWDVDTVHVVGDLQVREVETLEIFPGTMVLFHGEYYFEVQGSLRVVGTPDSPILFTVNDTTGFHNDTLPNGGWKQIRIENIPASVDSTVFKYCEFSYAKAVAADSVHGYGGAVCIRNTNRVSVSHCTFRNNYAFFSGGAVYLENASVLVENNHFEANRCGQTFAYYGYGGGLCTDWGNPVIRRNTFTLNSSTGIAGGLCVRFRDCPVSHNIFDDNFSALGGGFGILHVDTCRYVISNNLVINNGAAFFGGGISTNNCSPTYVNNTICNNHCEGGGGGFYCKDSVVPVLYNNILFGNTQYGGESNQVYLWDMLAQPDFYHNNVEGGFENFAGTGGTAFSGAWENNIDEDPQFAAGSFVPAIGSACINSGCPDTTGLMVPETDLAGLSRIVDEIIDMGAFENQQPVLTAEIPESGFVFHGPVPNPATEKVHFSFGFSTPGRLIFYITDLSGNVKAQIHSGPVNPGRHEFWYAPDQDLPAGIFLAVSEFNGKRNIRRVIILR